MSVAKKKKKKKKGMSYAALARNNNAWLLQTNKEGATRQKTGGNRNAPQLENGLISLTQANPLFKKINPLWGLEVQHK